MNPSLELSNEAYVWIMENIFLALEKFHRKVVVLYEP